MKHDSRFLAVSLPSALAAAVTFAAIALPTAARAGIGAWGGIVDTETFEKGFAVGGDIEVEALPWVFLRVRGGYEGGFDDLSLSEAGFKPGNTARRVLEDIGMDPEMAKMKDFSVVPVEGGLMLRPPALFGVIGVYGGGGAGWYFLPGFDVSYHGRTVSTDAVTDMVGWWAAAGAEINFPVVKVFAEAKYRSASKDGETFDLDFANGKAGAFRGDVDLTGLTILGGIRLSW